MHILVFGKTGQVACELARLDLNATFLSRQDVDLTDPGACAQAVLSIGPDAVINAAAWTNVDGAEESYAIAEVVNGKAPGAIATACAEIGAPLVHISTDYVFDGSGVTPFEVDDVPNPLCGYGRSKLIGEKSVVDSGATHAILRTSWVFSAHGQNFVKTMLRLGETRDQLNVVCDQIGGPTSAESIAVASVKIAAELMENNSKTGVYHFSGTPDVSWADFARAIFEMSGHTTKVTDIPSSQYPTPAKRPSNSRLNCTLTKTVFAVDQPQWRTDLRKVIDEVLKSD